MKPGKCFISIIHIFINIFTFSFLEDVVLWSLGIIAAGLPDDIWQMQALSEMSDLVWDGVDQVNSTKTADLCLC